jgi:hypothetical protein
VDMSTSPFTLASSNNTSGQVSVAVYATPAGSSLTGNNKEVLKISFTALASSGSTNLSFANTSAILNSSNNQDIWNGVSAGGRYTFGVGTNAISSCAYTLYAPGDHFYTSKAGDRAFASTHGYHDDGPVFAVSPTQDAGMVPIYSLYNGKYTDHWLTPDGANLFWGANFGGYRIDGLAFYAYPVNSSASSTACSQGVPVYQLWQGGGSEHFLTIYPDDVFWAINYGGYVFDGGATYHGSAGSVAFCSP